MNCGICGSDRTVFARTLPFRLPSGYIDSEISKCNGCGCYWRTFPSPVMLKEHFDIVAYTDTKKEERWKAERKPFFEDIVRTALSAHGKEGTKKRVLDVGCSYGHLLEEFQKIGCECEGIEPVDRLRNRLNGAKQFRIYRDIDQLLRRKSRYDIVTLIDTLYYSPQPLSYLKQLKQALADDGVMIIRITNRTPLLNLYFKWSPRRITNDIFGDQLYAFSHKSMKVTFEACNLRLISLKGFERKQRAASTRGARYFVYYRIMPLVASLTGLKVTPGLTYICRRN